MQKLKNIFLIKIIFLIFTCTYAKTMSILKVTWKLSFQNTASESQCDVHTRAVVFMCNNERINFLRSSVWPPLNRRGKTSLHVLLSPISCQHLSKYDLTSSFRISLPVVWWPLLGNEGDLFCIFLNITSLNTKICPQSVGRQSTKHH